MKIAPNFDPETFAKNRALEEKCTFWPRNFAKFGVAFGWCAWFFESFFAAQYLVAFFAIFLSKIFGFDTKNLSDFANTLLESALYLVLILLFILLPMKFLPRVKKYFSRKFSSKNFAKKSENFAKNSTKNLRISAQNSSQKSSEISRKNHKIFEKNERKNHKNFAKKFLKNVGLSRIPKLSDFGQALYFLPVFYFILIVANILANAIFGATTMSQEQNLSFATSGNSTFQLVIIFFALVILAPIAEEILLRGFLFTKLRTKFSSPRAGFWTTAILVSAVFSLAHGQLNVGIMTFILSMCNSRIRENSGAIYGAILLHACVNFLAFAIKYLGILHGIGY